MGAVGRAKAVAGRVTTGALDAWWTLPLGIYRLSGGKLARSSQLYRAEILRQSLLLDRLPGMTTATERAYFKWHVQEQFLGRGAVVDLGSWFGSTTAALAMGLYANPRPATRDAMIHAFDRFIWEPWMDSYSQMARRGHYASGDSFLGEFEQSVRRWRARIEVHVGDLCEQRWGEPFIEVLLVDAMKAWDVTYHVLTEFYPALLPAEGYVIHQDFGNCFTPWIHLVSHRLRERLVPVQDVPRSETMVFRTVRPLADRPDDLRLTRASFDEAEIEEAFEHSIQITRPEKHSGIYAARIVLLIYDGDLTRARQLLDLRADHGGLSAFHQQVVRDTLDRAWDAELA